MRAKIREFAQVVNGSTPSTNRADYYDGNIIWFTPKDLSDQNSKYIYYSERCITQVGYDSCSTQMIPAGNLLMSSRAPIGLLAINKRECCTNQGFKSFIVDETKCLVEYLYYYLKYHIKEVEALGSGTTFKEVSKNSIENYDIELPSLVIQNNIVSILKNIDAKIANNNAINAELEAMAKTIYDYWFLQFEFPDENGKPYKSSGGKMVWNEELKREIPAGWTVNTMEEMLIKNTMPFDYQSSKPTIDLSVMPSNSMTLGKLNTSDAFSTNLFVMKQGDILFGSIRPYLHKAGFAPCDGAVAGTVHSYINKKDIDYNFILCTLCSESFFDYAQNVAVGTKMPVVSSDSILAYKVAYCADIVSRFNMIKFTSIMAHNIQENQELASLRDFLLPLLMNGQVGFKEEI